MNIKIVNAVRDVGVTKGVTAPHFMECDDGMTYLVKFYSGGSKVAVNEHLGHSLARAVTLPSPKGVLVEVSAEMIGTRAT